MQTVVLAGGMAAVRKLPDTGRPPDAWRVRYYVGRNVGGDVCRELGGKLRNMGSASRRYKA